MKQMMKWTRKPRRSGMRNVEKAQEWLAGQAKNPTQSWYNLCQSLSRQAYSMPAFAPSARLAWFAIADRYKHPFRYDDKEAWAAVPRGAILYSIGPNSSSAGHAWVCSEPGESAWSNDYARHGKVDECPIKLKGWSSIYQNTVGWVDGTQWYSDNEGFFKGMSYGLWDDKIPPYENILKAHEDKTLASAAVWRLACKLADEGYGAKNWTPIKYTQTWPDKAMLEFNAKSPNMEDPTLLGPKGYKKLFGVEP